MTAVVAFGCWRCLQTGALCTTALLFELFHLGILVLWPWSATRHLYPIQPLLSFQFVYGAAELASRLPVARRSPRANARVAVTLAIVLGLISLRRSLVVDDSRRFTADLSIGAAWLAENSPATAVVMARYPAAVHLYSRRRTVDFAETAPPESLARALDEGVDYVLVAPELSWGALDTHSNDEQIRLLDEMAARGRVVLVFESHGRNPVRVYRVIR